MTRFFEGPADFRRSLDDRLRAAALRLGLPIDTLRTKVLIERLLARLFAVADAPWLLKGGYSLELRFRPRARTTRDIDLSVPLPRGKTHAERVERIVEELRKAAELDLHDFLSFEVGSAVKELGAPLQRGARFPVLVRLGGKEYGRFHVDVGFGDERIGAAEVLLGDDFMAFAGVDPARVRAISRAQQFAEKLHAYSRPWTGRENTRSKDLVDLVLLLERGRLRTASVRDALHRTFDARATHPVPERFPAPPPGWSEAYVAEALRLQLKARTLEAAESALLEFWIELRET